nr:hypothetical protein [Tanacetum cinerariifolium]
MVDFLATSPLRIETTDEGTHILAFVDGIQRTVSEASLRRNLKLRDEDGIVSIPDTELFENLTLMGVKAQVHQLSPITHPLLRLHYTTSSIPLPSFPTASIPIPTVTQTDTTPIIQYSRRERIAQSSALPTVADESASLVRDDSQGVACPTDSGFIADQDRATIAKSSTLPRDSALRVTSPAAKESSMQQTLNELMAFCTSLQRQHLEL